MWVLEKIDHQKIQTKIPQLICRNDPKYSDTSGKHLRVKMTLVFLYLYSKKREWWGIVQNQLWISIVINVNFYRELVN